MKFFIRVRALLLAALLALSAAAAFPAFGAGGVTLNALFEKIENYKTGRGQRTFFIVGFSSDADAIVKAAKNDSLRFVFTVRDENDGTQTTFEYHSRNAYEIYDADSLDFLRVPVCEYGVVPDPAHAYTLSFTAYDGAQAVYTGSSGDGAFRSSNEDFLNCGPIVPDLSRVEVVANSPIEGKKLLFAGDSITEAICEVNIPEENFIAGWPGRIAAANGAYSMNLGMSGATISNKNGSNQVLNQLKDVAGRRFDAVILHGGTNDAWFEAPVGAITPDDVRSEGSFDVTTFAGGLEETFRYAKEQFPDAKIGFIVNFSMPSSEHGTTNDMYDLFELAKAICSKWEIPYLDLYNNAELNENRLHSATRYALGDYVHPNDRGYNILYPYVDQFVKALFTGRDPASLPDPPYAAPETPAYGENVALGKTAKTSSGAAAPAATDGKTDGYVSLGNWADTERSPAYGTDGTCYLTVDLGAVYDLNAINVVNYVGNLLYKWDAYLTDDASREISAWTKAGGKTTNEQSYEDGYTITFPSTPARYVRIYGMGHTGTAWVLNEVRAYGVFNEEATLGGVTLEKVAPTGAKLPSGESTGLLTDGVTDRDPAVTGRIEGGYVVVDLQKETALSALKITTAESNSAYSVFGSIDGSEYEFLTKKEIDNAVSVYECGVSGSFRYLKLLWEDSRRADRYVGLAEVAVFDEAGNALTGMTAGAVNAVYGGNNPVDGNVSTYTFINPPKNGFSIDLGAEKTVRKIVVYPVDVSLPFGISVSTGGTTYASYAAYAGDGTAEAITLYAEAQARTIDLLPGGYDGEGFFGLYEVEIYTGPKTEKPDDPDDPSDPGQNDDPGQTTDLTGLSVASLGKPAVVYTTPARTNTTDYELKSAPGVTDGKTSDVWVYGAFGKMYAQIDLDVEYEVGAVNVRTYYNATYGGLNHAWSVYLSTDGETFVKAGAVEKTPHPEEGITLTFARTKARYVRVVADFYVTSEQFSFKEVTVYGKIPEKPLVPTGGATVTLPDGTTTGLLTNGVYTDEVRVSGAGGGFMTVDLQAEKPVDSVAVYTYENNSAYAVFGSVNGSAWTTLGYKDLDAAANTENGWEYILPVSGSYRYIRVQWAVGRSSPADGYLTVKEIDVSYQGDEYAGTVTNVKCVYNNQNANDGNYSNYNFCYKASGALQIELPEVRDVRKLTFYAASAPALRVEYSADGQTYFPFGNLLPDGAWEPGTGASLTAVYTKTRYLRVICLSGEELALSEIEIYAATDAVKGDLDGDGNVNISDVTALLNYIANASSVPAAGAAAADLDGNGNVDISDVTALLNQIAGK